MSERDLIRLYAVHGWENDDDYIRLFEYLESADNFFYRTMSDPVGCSPHDDGTVARRTLIEEALKQSECVICSASTWERYNDWARFTVETARRKALPVIAIEHFGPKEMDPILKARAAQVVGWDSRSIVDAIRRSARQEDPSRFDMIEFDM